MKVIAILFYFGFAVLLVSCQLTGISATIPPEVLPVETEIPENSPSETAVLTQERLSTPVTDVPEGTKPPIDCIETSNSASSSILSYGLVVLENRTLVDGRFAGNDAILDLASSEITEFGRENERGIDYSVSPDSRVVAYHRTTLDLANNVVGEELVIVSSGGQQLAAIPWEGGWYRIVDWLDNQHLIINIALLDSEESSARKAASLLLLNPYTGERQVLLSDYPGIYYFPPIPDWDSWGITVYDPTLSRVVYLQAITEGEYLYSLWDLQTQRLLGSMRAAFMETGYLPAPVWSPDGSRFVVSAFQSLPPSFELFLVSRDGQIEKLTDLNAVEESFFWTYSWSPDGRYIAGWIGSTSLAEAKEARLVVVDTMTKQVANYCLAALGVATTTMLNIVERQRELGLLRAVGATRRHVTR
ncbi:MAG: hypothetical protein MN733_35910, partial [Nitrososphaera sp.]|nr:hypothetical protein [Nitrososphaera sp.]